MFIERFFAPKPKKNNHAAAKIVACVAAAVALMPLAATYDKKRKSWGFGGLLYSFTKKPSRHCEGKNEYTLTFPGIGFVIMTWRRAARIMSITCATRKATRAAAECCCCDDCGDVCEMPEATDNMTEQSTEN